MEHCDGLARPLAAKERRNGDGKPRFALGELSYFSEI